MIFKNRYGYLLVLGIASYTFINTLICDVYRVFNMPIHVFVAYAVILFITFLCWETSKHIHPIISKYFKKDADALKRKILFFLVAVSSCLVINYFLIFAFTKYIMHNTSTLHNPIKLTSTYIILVLILFHLLNIIVYYMNKVKEKEKLTLVLQRANTLAQLQSIKAQLNPHFLFNNLNVLSSLVIRENPEANLFIENFASIYHYVLSMQDAELTTLEKELDFLENYSFLLARRFPDSIVFNTTIPKNKLNFKIVPLGIQMLVENAIKHNVLSKTKQLIIDIDIQNNNLIVRNKLAPKINKEPASNLGLHNINQRYEIITGKKISIKKDDAYFEVGIPLIN
jgi:two-component system, LytTR family, sensor kinase